MTKTKTKTKTASRPATRATARHDSRVERAGREREVGDLRQEAAYYRGRADALAHVLGEIRNATDSDPGRSPSRLVEARQAEVPTRVPIETPGAGTRIATPPPAPSAVDAGDVAPAGEGDPFRAYYNEACEKIVALEGLLREERARPTRPTSETMAVLMERIALSFHRRGHGDVAAKIRAGAWREVSEEEARDYLIHGGGLHRAIGVFL